MDGNPTEHVREPEPSSILAIVVGAHLEAEVSDRPVADGLREAILGWQDELGCDERLSPVVVTDLWYLNDDALRLQPAITIGRPEINAAAAFLATRVPTALVADEAFRIQLDVELVDERACIWGMDGRTTAAAVDVFVERYLDDYLRAVHRLPSDVF